MEVVGRRGWICSLSFVARKARESRWEQRGEVTPD